MSDTLLIGSTNSVSLRGLENQDAAADAALSTRYPITATVVLTGLYDDTDTVVSGTSGLSMPYISGTGTSTLYRGVIPHTVSLTDGAVYTRRVTVTDADGNVRRFDKKVTARVG